MIEDSLLWEIRQEGIDHASYIFGTIHLNSPSAPVFIHVLDQLCDQVDVIYTETSLDQSIDPGHYQIPDKQTLSELVGERKYARAKRIIKKAFRVDLDQFDGILPLLTAQNIGLLSQNMHMQPSLDSQIFQLAVRKGLEYKGLESMKEQLQIMKQIPLDYQVNALLRISRNVRSFRKSFKRLIELYEAQKIAQLYRSSKKQLGPIRKLLLYDRNELMVGRIAEQHSRQPTLFTFGAGHLAGGRGVLALLKRKGFYSKAIKMNLSDPAL